MSDDGKKFEEQIFEESAKPTLAEQLLTRSMLRDLPKPEPLISGVLDMGTNPLLYGKWGTAKSFIALDWALSVGTGRSWQGRATKQRKVLYIVSEGAFGFRNRVEAWEQGWQTKVNDEQVRFLPIPVNLTHMDEVTELGHLIYNYGYSFVIIDTLARCMVGADENSAKDIGIVVDSMTRLIKYTPEQRGVVLGVHHAGKDGKTMRGSSAFEGGADTVYFASRDEEAPTMDISLVRTKRKDGPEYDVHALTIDPVEGTESCVMSKTREMSENERFNHAAKLLSVFIEHFASTGGSKSELKLVAAMEPATFYRALSELLSNGEITNTGTDKVPFYKLKKVVAK